VKTKTKSWAQRSDGILKTIPFLACLSGEEFSGLKKLIVGKKFRKGMTILSEEDTGSCMYIILSGKVKAVHASADGKEHILAIHQRGDFFGEMALLDGKTAPAMISALEDTDVAILAKRDFEEYLLSNGRVLRQIIAMLSMRLRESWMMLKILNLPEAEQRVRETLRLVSMQYGAKDARGSLITVKLTHQDIADYASVSRETVTRILSRFIKEGVLEVLPDRNILLKTSF
jgi:CRP/FNR family transcriptional regulator